MINHSGTEKTAGSAEQCQVQPAVSVGRPGDHHDRPGDQPVLTHNH